MNINLDLSFLEIPYSPKHPKNPNINTSNSQKIGLIGRIGYNENLKIALLRLPSETDLEYQDRCQSHYDLLIKTKSWSLWKPLPSEKYSYPIEDAGFLYYPLFRVEVK